MDQGFLSAYYRRFRSFLAGSSISFDNAINQPTSSSSSLPPSPYVIIFGGTGFVGSAVTREALSRGVSVISVSRHGPRPSSIPPPPPTDSVRLAYQITDIQTINQLGDEEKLYFQSLFKGSSAVISCVGAFGGVEYMTNVNGRWNVDLVRNAKLMGARKFIYVSSHIYPAHEALQKGYFTGKKMTEKALMNEYADNGVILRCGFIYGNRMVGGIPIPLSLLGKPLEWLSRFSPIHSLYQKYAPSAAAGENAVANSWKGTVCDWLFTSPEPVEAVAKTIIDAALDNEGKMKGILETDDIHRIGHQK